MKKVKLISVLAIAACVMAVSYIGVLFYQTVINSYKTTTATVTTVPHTIDADMFIIREEIIVESDSKAKGVVVPLAVNGEKISAGGEIAAVFDSEKSAENYTTSISLDKKLETYRTINNQVKLANIDLDALSNEIDSDFYAMLKAVYDNDFTEISDTQLSFSEKLSRKNVSLGFEVDCTAQIKDLEEQISKLKVTAPKSIISAEESGYFVSRPDGYENTIKAEDIDSLTADMLNEAMSAKKNKISNNTIGKIITGYDWYIATILPNGLSTGLDVGKSYTLMLGDSEKEKITAKVYARKSLENKNVLLVFQTSIMNEQLATIRKVNGKILAHNYRGIKIDKNAVRINENKQKGVYIVEGNLVKFNRIEEIGYVDNYVIIKDNTGKTGWLAQYDEVIISGKGLENGKVIS